jgi:hypothetical protein
LIRGHGSKASAALCAFDLLELDGEDLRRQSIEKRKELLTKLLKGSHLSVVLNEHFNEDGASVYRAACQLGCEGKAAWFALSRWPLKALGKGSGERPKRIGAADVSATQPKTPQGKC